MCQLFLDADSIYEILKLYLNKFGTEARTDRRTDRWIDRGMEDKPKVICLFNFPKFGAYKSYTKTTKVKLFQAVFMDKHSCHVVVKPLLFNC